MSCRTRCIKTIGRFGCVSKSVGPLLRATDKTVRVLQMASEVTQQAQNRMKAINDENMTQYHLAMAAHSRRRADYVIDRVQFSIDTFFDQFEWSAEAVRAEQIRFVHHFDYYSPPPSMPMKIRQDRVIVKYYPHRERQAAEKLFKKLQGSMPEVELICWRFTVNLQMGTGLLRFLKL